MRAASLQDRFTNVCYRQISPHLDVYRAEQCLENCLPLMELHIFYRFIEEACNGVADLVANEAYNKYRALGYFPAAVRQLNPECLDGNDLHNKLASCLGPVVGALKQFAPELNGFRQALRASSSGELQVLGQRLQQFFNRMLHAYDQSMAAVMKAAFAWLDDYDNALRRARGF